MTIKNCVNLFHSKPNCLFSRKTILSPPSTKTYPQLVKCAAAELQNHIFEEGIRSAKHFIRADTIASLKSYGFAEEGIIESMVSDSILNDVQLQYRRGRNPKEAC